MNLIRADSIEKGFKALAVLAVLFVLAFFVYIFSTPSPTSIKAEQERVDDYYAGYQWESGRKRGYEMGADQARAGDGIPTKLGLQVMANVQAQAQNSKYPDSYADGFKSGFASGYEEAQAPRQPAF